MGQNQGAVCHPRAAGSVYFTPVQYSGSSAGSVSEGRVLVRRCHRVGSPGRTKVALSQAGALTRYHSFSDIYSPFWSFLLLAQAKTQSPRFPPKDIIPGGTQLRPAEGLADLHICTPISVLPPYTPRLCPFLLLPLHRQFGNAVYNTGSRYLAITLPSQLPGLLRGPTSVI